MRQGLSCCSLGSGCIRGPVGGRVGEAAAGGVPRSNPQEARLQNILEPADCHQGRGSFRAPAGVIS